MKLLEYNIGENLTDFGHVDDLLDKKQKTQFMKEIHDKQGFIKIKRLCSKKDVKRMRR